MIYTIRPRNAERYNVALYAMHKQCYFDVREARGNTPSVTIHPPPEFPVLRPAVYVAWWVRIVLSEYSDAEEFPPAWWAFARRFRKHLELLVSQAGRHATSEFLRWLTDPENMP